MGIINETCSLLRTLSITLVVLLTRSIKLYLTRFTKMCRTNTHLSVKPFEIQILLKHIIVNDCYKLRD